MSKEKSLSPEQRAYLAQVVEQQVGVDYKELLSAFKEDPAFLEYRQGSYALLI